MSDHNGKKNLTFQNFFDLMKSESKPSSDRMDTEEMMSFGRVIAEEIDDAPRSYRKF